MFRPLCVLMISKMSKLYFRTQYQQRKLKDLQIYRIWVGCLSVNALVDHRVVESLEIDRQMPHLSVSLYLMSSKLYAYPTWSMSPPSQPMLPSGPLQSTRFCSDSETNLPVACGTDVILILQNDKVLKDHFEVGVLIDIIIAIVVIINVVIKRIVSP